jgi:glycerol-3-phosphate acyltransferase PlsY
MFQGITPVFWLVLVVAVLVIVKHRANIRRLLNGTESKFGRSSATAA